MKSEEFNEIIEAAIIKIQQTLLKKGTEYAPGADTDRLANFRKAANLQGVNMKQALQGMLAKHTVSIADMIASGDDYPQAVWDEKIGDSLVYHLLLTAVVWEEKNQDWTEEDLHKNDVALPDVPNSTKDAPALSNTFSTRELNGNTYLVFSSLEQAKKVYPGQKIDVQPIHWLSPTQSIFVGTTHYHVERVGA